EFSIPKSELEHYDSNEELGIIIGGYGTLGYINGSNFWVFSTIDYRQYIEDNSYYNYYNMKGVESPGGWIRNDICCKYISTFFVNQFIVRYSAIQCSCKSYKCRIENAKQKDRI
ncbi:unnamed protein product, partial [marine sediment metagenome]